MSGITIVGKRNKTTTLGTLVISAVALTATGFLFAAGYDIYARLFRKAA